MSLVIEPVTLILAAIWPDLNATTFSFPLLVQLSGIDGAVLDLEWSIMNQLTTNFNKIILFVVEGTPRLLCLHSKCRIIVWHLLNHHRINN